MQKPEALREAHWSASRFMLFEMCPRQYRDRYVDGIASPPSLAMLFGNTVHKALEAMHQGHGGPCPASCGSEDHYTIGRYAYTEQFDRMGEALAGLRTGRTAPALFMEGLRMLDQVASLRLNDDGRSESERWFTLPTASTWN